MKGEWRNLLQGLIDDSSETSSVCSANPYYPHPCTTFCCIAPCSVFSSVLLLLYIATALAMKETNHTCLVGRVVHWHTGLWYNLCWEVSTDAPILINIDVLAVTLGSLCLLTESKGWAVVDGSYIQYLLELLVSSSGCLQCVETDIPILSGTFES